MTSGSACEWVDAMRLDKLADMNRGWFVGDFHPTVLRSRDVEVAVKHYDAGDNELLHHHRVSTELTVVVTGRVRMNGEHYGAGDIVSVEPGEATDFHAETDAITVVVKLPCVVGDKYLGENENA